MRGMMRAAAVLALLVVGMLPYGHEASAATFQVAMKGYAFAPASLSVPAGSTVTWTNYDTAPHDVKTTSGPLAIHSPMLNKGESWSFTFTTAGAYGYVCTVHPDMTAGITVRAAAPAPTPTQHEHTQPSTSRQQHSTMPGMTTSRSPAATRAGSSPSPTQSQAAVPQTAPSPQAPQAAATQTAASTARPLDPLLILAGLVAGVAVLCLLLVGSRAAATAPRGSEEGA
ncbi:plastocyanin/multisubunit Na+/H+ antiporter MnhC subunit [Streptomyces canus]|uniref:Plastocyanin/multisubunit Na+/H+ antiporter MnhC subunit n=1 Tax=Streptomyces canus TaxID=58343 RepID=A0AAW8FMJ8_9ACTN|nr:cupredoxin family copper-binding protein [Streptomyces canus]MDQ0910058.1 plastocyanin/multisubunit Na+/H+ antiporter MnhC subunit [Streptomyces canus]